VGSDLLSAPLSRDVLSVYQLRSSTIAGKRDQILGDHGDRATRAFLPWSVSGGLDYHLAHGAPAGVVRIAARDQETR
jgi:hypothetical protein